MANLRWFWRLVCEPDCSDACQVNCPGCRAMAPEWEAQGRRTVAADAPATPFRWRRIGTLWRCWSRSVMARTIGRANPLRLVGRPARRPAGQAAGCGCASASTVTEGALATAGCGCGGTSSPSDQGAAVTRDVVTRDAVIRDEVQRHYSDQARRVMAGVQDGCCSPGLPADVSCTTMYAEDELRDVPANALVAALGCGNPMARASLRPGEVVLDLGSGGGMDVLVAAGKVGPRGRVYGLDASDDMLELAHANAARAGASNVVFLRGELESVPLPDASVDAIISNCVVNLTPDKGAALREAHRVLRPGGRLAISDIVTRVPVPDALKGSLTAWAACVGGALSQDEYERHLRAAGFVDIVIERDREYTAADAESAGLGPVLRRDGLDAVLQLGFASTGINARRPGAPERTSPDREPHTAANTRAGNR